MSGVPVASGLLARLERELHDLWTVPDTDPRAVPKSRVCTMNLEVIAPSAELLERYTPVVDEVTASIPARVIVASFDRSSIESSMTGSATAVCSLLSGRNMCSERITLAASGKACARVASAVEALLVPELPTVLVWLGPANVEDPLFEQLAQHTDRVLFDSAYTGLASLVGAAAWARDGSHRPHLSDLAWTRLAPWQELVARFFDDTATRPFATGITRLALTQASGGADPVGSEIALLVGWMATRLGWTATRTGRGLRFESAAGATVQVEIDAIACPPGVAPRSLARVCIEASDGTSNLRGRVERVLGSGLSGTTLDADVIDWTQELTNAAPIQQRVRLGPNKAAKWLERTLHRSAHDEAFDESIAFAERIVAAMPTVHPPSMA